MKQYAIIMLCLLVTAFSYGQKMESLGTNNTGATTMDPVHDDPVLGKNPFDVKIETNKDIPSAKLQEYLEGDQANVTFIYSTLTPMDLDVNLKCQLSTNGLWSSNNISITLDQQVSNRLVTDTFTGVSTFFKVPANIPDGAYYILVKLEPSIEFVEENTANNIFKKKVYFGRNMEAETAEPRQEEHQLLIDGGK